MSKPAEFRFDDITLRQEAQFSVELTAESIDLFADLSGDINPLHMNEEYAEGTPFGGRIAHGMLGASYISRLIGVHLPGRHALYLSQKLAFKKPLRVGMRLLVRGEVTHKTAATKTILIKTEILDEKTGECLIDGEAAVKLLE